MLFFWENFSFLLSLFWLQSCKETFSEMKFFLSVTRVGKKRMATKIGKTHGIPLHFQALIFVGFIALVVFSLGFSVQTYSLTWVAADMSLSTASVPDFTNYILRGPNVSEIGPSFTYPTNINDAPPRLLHYLMWHEKQMKCIRNYSCYEHKKSTMKIVVWKCPLGRTSPCAGMGDRFRGIVSSLVLSMITGHVFLLDWPHKPYPFYHAVSPAAIDWRVPDFVLRDCEDWGILSLVSYPSLEWRKCPSHYHCTSQNLFQFSDLQESQKKRIQYFMNASDTRTYSTLKNIQHFVVLSRSTYSHMLIKRPEWTEKYGESRFLRTNVDLYLHRIFLRILFKPSPITQTVIEYVHRTTELREGYWSIHARTGQDVSENNLKRFHNMSTIDDQFALANRFMKCLLQLNEQSVHVNGTHGFPIFFASDSIALKTALCEVAKDYGVQIIFVNSPAMHVGSKFMRRAKRWGTIGSLPINGPSWLSFINTYVEFFLLANGSVSLSNQSEFSRLAFVLSNGQIFRSFDAREDLANGQCRLKEMDIPILRVHASHGLW